jgi:CRISPR system Cascade subunit CasA
MNLITDPWIPIIRRSGATDTICPWQIVEAVDPVVALSVPRADFNGAMVQFLISLLQTAYMPERESHWRDLYKSPPQVEVLCRAFEAYSHVFYLNGDGPRFMQDIDPTLDKLEPRVIASLLIDEPGEKSLKDNKDFFKRAGTVSHMSLAYATMALYTLQLNAPAGGAGYRTSLRGGGPLTTLVIPKNLTESTLWQLLWLNVMSKETLGKLAETALDEEDCEEHHIFPWMYSTRTSEKGSRTETTMPAECDWRHVYWAMPSRVRLQFPAVGARCGISFAETDCVAGYVTKNYGANYTGWRHPLSPHYQSKDDWLPIHPQPGGMSYRHFLGWTLGHADPKKGIEIARIVSLYRRERRQCKDDVSLWAFGYDMDNAKARGWQESVMPLFVFEDDETGEKTEALQRIVTDILSATEEVAANLRSCVRNAWKVEKGDTSFVTTEFWQMTEAAFYRLVNDVYDRIDRDSVDQVDDLRKEWHGIICKKTEEIFDAYVMTSDVTFEDTEKIVRSRQNLRGYNRKKTILNAMHIPIHSKSGTKKKKENS